MSDKPEDDLTAIGNVAKIFGGVTQEQVQQAHDVAKGSPQPMRLGEALVASGALDARQRDAMLRAQKRLRHRASMDEIAKVVQYVQNQAVATMEKLAEAIDDAEAEGGDDD